MKEKAKITNIELGVGGKKINLSMEEAKELKTILNELFANSDTPMPTPYPAPYYIPDRRYRPACWEYRPWEVTWTSESYPTISGGTTHISGDTDWNTS